MVIRLPQKTACKFVPQGYNLNLRRFCQRNGRPNSFVRMILSEQKLVVCLGLAVAAGLFLPLQAAG